MAKLSSLSKYAKIICDKCYGIEIHKTESDDPNEGPKYFCSSCEQEFKADKMHKCTFLVIPIEEAKKIEIDDVYHLDIFKNMSLLEQVNTIAQCGLSDSFNLGMNYEDAINNVFYVANKHDKLQKLKSLIEKSI